MIFCPSMDMKRDEWKSRFISVRTGLGYNDEKKCPYYAEHDAVFPLDFEFTADDLNLVSIDSFPNSKENGFLSLNLLVDRSIKFVTRSIHCCLHPVMIQNAIQCQRNIGSKPCRNSRKSHSSKWNWKRNSHTHFYIFLLNFLLS